MTKSSEQSNAEAEALFKQHPDIFPPELQEKVWLRQVEVGMDPYMSRLAGGACTFEVIADSTKWPVHAHPQRVMDAQTLHPDASQITLTFENATQYPGEGLTRFRVSIINGRVKNIEKLNSLRKN